MSDWLAVTQGKTFATEADYRKALAKLRFRAKMRAGAELGKALAQYIKANDGNIPEKDDLLAPYLPKGFNKAILARYTLNPSGSMGKDVDVTEADGPAIFVLKQTAPADAIWNSPVFISAGGSVAIRSVNDTDGNIVEEAIADYKSQFNVEPTKFSQIASAIKNRVAKKRAEAIFSAYTAKPELPRGSQR